LVYTQVFTGRWK